MRWHEPRSRVDEDDDEDERADGRSRVVGTSFLPAGAPKNHGFTAKEAPS